MRWTTRDIEVAVAVAGPEIGTMQAIAVRYPSTRTAVARSMGASAVRPGGRRLVEGRLAGSAVENPHARLDGGIMERLRGGRGWGDEMVGWADTNPDDDDDDDDDDGPRGIEIGPSVSPSLAEGLILRSRKSQSVEPKGERGGRGGRGSLDTDNHAGRERPDVGRVPSASGTGHASTIVEDKSSANGADPEGGREGRGVGGEKKREKKKKERGYLLTAGQGIGGGVISGV